MCNLARGLSLICIIFCKNKTADDLVSFLNYLCHVIPTIILLTMFLLHVRHFIEKFYEITLKMKDVFFIPTINFFITFVYVALFTLSAVCIGI